ncbi:MAG: TIGR04282 family arsenosugar biosynthesis glycosyltransferase [Vulcanococcus sp.]|jgi:rSAM/selenodomain-associated transferase 1|uniref:TIGR04282 family arsenosugar biosynthesis glycosyltransferase n=1 Tax=Vulcanococcus sp. TaxID=2856995 RepID=UPI0025E412E8|nr:TIGR04282 family arsenosugar biosynthesis glycosyltransferase [Vulcanococcus sp.]MBW0174963.1 TIGR04282 family arsenosugar biosynthesis glycosyltransferase [Vulcanococcus sp.]MBW0181128.1 TIGR04282 family arsenosugar biosynthesis glycosyltransferase [Vulcanococcus sp.]
MPIARGQLVVLARWPAPGRCKQRLAASCGSSRLAAAMQRRLSWHTLHTAAAAAQRCGAELLLSASGLGPRALRRWGDQLQRSLPVPLHWALQPGGNLGCRMHRQLQQGFVQGFEQVVLIGSDLPDLHSADLEQAFALLEQHDLVLGPAADGGYWLIGLTRQGFQRSSAALFSGIPWSSDQVLSLSLERAAQRELTVGQLRQQSDLDGRSALEPWLLLRRDR